MLCKYCKYEMNGGQKFCPRCGMYVEDQETKQALKSKNGAVICPVCKTESGAEALFCLKCGTYLRGENKDDGIMYGEDIIAEDVEFSEGRHEETEELPAPEMAVSKSKIIRTAIIFEIAGLIFAYLLAWVMIYIVSWSAAYYNKIGFKTINMIAQLPNNLLFLTFTSLCITAVLSAVKFKSKSPLFRTVFFSGAIGIFASLALTYIYAKFFIGVVRGTDSRAFWPVRWPFIMAVTSVFALIAARVMVGGRVRLLNVIVIIWPATLLLVVLVPHVTAMRMLEAVIGRQNVMRSYRIFSNPGFWIFFVAVISAILTTAVMKLKKR